MLIKRELSTVPESCVPNLDGGWNSNAYVANVSTVELKNSGEILVIDIFRPLNRMLSLRFFSDGKNYLICDRWPANKWEHKNPNNYFKTNDRIECSDSGIKIAKKFIGVDRGRYGMYRHTGIMELMDDFAYHKSAVRREKSAEAKNTLMHQHFDMFPQRPVGLSTYCNHRVFGYGYIFYSKLHKDGSRDGVCSQCGAVIDLPRKIHSGTMGVCPSCNCASVYRGNWLTKDVIEKEKLCICHKVNDQLLIRWVSVERQFCAPKFECEYQFSDYAYNLHLHTNDGACTYFYKWIRGPYQWYHDWYRGKNGDYCYDETYVYTENLNEVFGESYYNVNLKKGLEDQHIKVAFAELLNQLKNSRKAEYLFKMRMPHFAANAKRLGETGDRIGFSEVLGVSGQLKELYRNESVTLSEHYVIKSYGKWVSKEHLEQYRALKIPSDSTDIVKDILREMSMDKFLRYFGRQRAIEPKCKIGTLLMYYRDYINMSVEIGVDLSHKSVRYPSNCKDAHDMILPRFNSIKHEVEDKTFAEVTSKLYQTLRVQNFATNGLCIVLPKLRSELITEGQSLNHCVGGDDYYKRHISGQKMIFFVRKDDEIEKPFFTLEIDMESHKVTQLYGYGDCSPSKEVRAFATAFARALRPKERMVS